LKLNSLGVILWQNNIGGLFDDLLFKLHPTNDGYILSGSSSSNISGDKTENSNGANDYWNVKLFPEDCIPISFYSDADLDGYGNSLISTDACFAPLGYVLNNLDCNDTDNLINPGVIEVCNEIDDDCNFIIDDALPLNTFYFDADSDGYGNLLITLFSCSEIPPLGYTTAIADCDDENPLIHEPILFFADLDGDLYGDELNSDLYCTLVPPIGYVTNNLDCNDSTNLINPLTNEVCNNLDDNCNTYIDESIPNQTLYIDADGDDFGNFLNDTITCFFEITRYVIDSSDCDDTNPEIYPGSLEILNGLDDNCNQLIDDGLVVIENFEKDAIRIFPNPSFGQINILSHVELNNIIVYDMLGQSVINVFEINQNFLQFDISFLLSGCYTVEVNLKDKKVYSKFIIN